VIEEPNIRPLGVPSSDEILRLVGGAATGRSHHRHGSGGHRHGLECRLYALVCLAEGLRQVCSAPLKVLYGAKRIGTLSGELRSEG
jgi:hypothetical protein